MVKLEALNAKFGDALLLSYKDGKKQRLWIIDGGPAGTWKPYLKPRLDQLRGAKAGLVADVAMLSHVDDDHVNGMLAMTKDMAGGRLQTLDVRRFWHNSFTDLVGSEASVESGMATLAGAVASAKAATAAFEPTSQIEGKKLDGRETAVLASINQGRELRDYLEQLQLSGNDPFGGLLSSKSGKKKIDGAQVTVVGPIKSRLDKFRQKWKDAVGKPAALVALFSDKLDESPTNLSSIVMLVEVNGSKILLTGDARGDDIVQGFKEAGLAGKLPMKLDILKMPHHGSWRNITEKFLKSFPARHYIFSADGKHGNPDPPTIKALVDVRGKDTYTMHFTNKVSGLPALLTKLSKGKNFDYVFRDPSQLSIVVELDD